MSLLEISKIDQASILLKPFINLTPLVTNETINELLNAKIYFKLESLQPTGSFKIRGATYKISLLSNKQKNKGVLAYSSGNHAQAVAYAAKNIGIQSTIIMPKNAPKIKIKNTKNYGADIILYDPKTQNREEICQQISLETGKTIIKPYDDIDIITGQATVGKEIVEQLARLEEIPDIYLCCVGGGGLISGSSYYLKKKYTKIENYAVEPEGFDDTLRSLQSNKIVSNKLSSNSICDALLIPQPGKITFEINKSTLKGGLVVNDIEVKKTIKIIAEELKLMVEPGGAVATAALLTRKIKVNNKIVIVMISGGNIDQDFFSEIINQDYE